MQTNLGEKAGIIAVGHVHSIQGISLLDLTDYYWAWLVFFDSAIIFS